MDKIVRSVLVLSLFIVSCSKKVHYDENINNVKVVIEKDITIDFKSEKILIDYDGLIYEDTIIFTKNEKNNIIDYYNKFNLNDKCGDFWYFDENSTTASLHDEIIIFENNKIKSRSIINSYYEIKNCFFENQEIKTVKFRNLIKQIIINKNSYKKAEDSLRVFIKRKPRMLM
ncbi:hypothetical protein [Flavobacterium aquicola]|uniref:Uncharacterized protein n=1 Tax=Flavobacterium aquicola TaxID=1682742 RepID=A0A3E0EJT4_9FLAO|nr:hypothetical protein [Flavobacterium aquicola]REG97990.1 hypothetical protein C8P67_108156 [Flavobacterium aquicola]